MAGNITDMNVLYDAFRASMKGSAWKEEPQRFEIDFLTEIIKLSNELENRTYIHIQRTRKSKADPRRQDARSSRQTCDM